MHLPHVMPFARAPLYFFTACTAKRRALLANKEAFECLTEIWKKSLHLDVWSVGRFVLMPDHVHLFAAPSPDAKKRADWIKLWKSVSARRLNPASAGTQPFWQADTFDHILRSGDSYSQKWEYVRMNPVRQGLVGDPAEWPWQGEISQLSFD